MSNKICNKCKIEYPLTKFYFSNRDKIYFGTCKTCDKERGYKYRNKNRERTNYLARIRYRENDQSVHISQKLMKRYGISLDDYNKIQITQEGKCLICKNLSGKLYIDHCHKTNKFRGLLCPSCNTAIGLFRDNINILTNAIKYLEENK